MRMYKNMLVNNAQQVRVREGAKRCTEEVVKMKARRELHQHPLLHNDYLATHYVGLKYDLAVELEDEVAGMIGIIDENWKVNDKLVDTQMDVMNEVNEIQYLEDNGVVGVEDNCEKFLAHSEHC